MLFGSYARNQQGKESDIDLFIESDIPTNKLITSTAYNRFHDELYEEFDYTVPPSFCRSLSSNRSVLLADCLFYCNDK